MTDPARPGDEFSRGRRVGRGAAGKGAACRWISCAGRWNGWRGLEGHALSAHAFVSLWLWKEALGLELCVGEEYFSARAGEDEWLFPCGSERGRLAFLAEHANEPGARLRYLRSQDAGWLAERFPGQWELIRRPEDDEYLYLREPHIAMEGGALPTCAGA